MEKMSVIALKQNHQGGNKISLLIIVQKHIQINFCNIVACYDDFKKGNKSDDGLCPKGSVQNKTEQF